MIVSFSSPFMRAALLLAAWLVGDGAMTPSAAQGQLVFDNRVLQTVVAPVYGPDPDHPYRVRQGNGPEGFPAGTQVYGGPLLRGTAYTAQLFGGAPGALEEALTPLWPAVGFREDAVGGFVEAPALALTVPGFAEDQTVQLQLRVWDNRGGTVTNWSQVLGDDSIARGASRAFVSQPLGGVLLPPPNLVGLESFNIAAIPPPPGPPMTVTRIESAEGPALRVTFPRQAAVDYDMLASPNLEDWESIGVPVAIDGQTMEFVVRDWAEHPRRFYRYRMQPWP